MKADGAVGGTFGGSAHVVCVLCGQPAAPERLFWGCGACGVAAPLTLAGSPEPPGGIAVGEAAHDGRRLLGEMFGRLGAATPLVSEDRFGPGVFLKNEAFSLTGSHKDRLHAVTSRVARRLGARGIVASSTGNHGVSVAAHAAAVGLPSVVFCHPEAPVGLLRAIGAFGGVAAQLEATAQRAELVALVRAGWFPATSMDPALSGAANPFGAEGYKAIAYETAEQLGRLPEAVFVPTAGGDTLYGVMRGFAELAAASGERMPTVFAIQPAGANPLSRSLAAQTSIDVDDPRSIALSIADPRTGRHAMAAIARWGGQALDVSEDAIRASVAALAGIGVYADPASAAALAGWRAAESGGAIAPDAVSVLLLTSSGFKWPDAMADVFAAGAARDVEALRQRLADRATG